MTTLKEWRVGQFTGLGREVDHEGGKVRPEVAVSIASGKVSNIDLKNADNANITFNVTGAKYGYGGFINTSDPVFNLLKQAHENDTVICVRFEKKRKKNVSPITPIEELTKDMSTAKDNISRVIAGAYNVNTNSWILTRDAQSNPMEDPSEIAVELQKIQYDTSSFFAKPTAKVQGQADDKANILVSMYFFIREREAKHGFELNEDQRRKLSLMLLAAADRLQTTVYNLDAPNYRDYSHTRARYILFSYEEINPLNLEAIKNFKVWAQSFVEQNVDMWRWAIASSDDGSASDE